MTDWFDPLGFRGIADRAFTSAARTLVGRRIEVGASTPMAATVARVHEASPAVSVSAALNAQIGLWRRLDLVLERVEVGDRSMHRVKVVADDVRVVDALPQRLRAKRLTLEIELVPAQVEAWIDAIPLKVDAHVENGRVVTRHPGYGRWGEVILEPWVKGREIGAHAVAVRTRGREVRLPGRFKRTFSRELTWLPDGTDLRKLEFSNDGGARITATITQFDVAIDVPRLLTDLSSRSTQLAVETIKRPL